MKRAFGQEQEATHWVSPLDSEYPVEHVAVQFAPSVAKKVVPVSFLQVVTHKWLMLYLFVESQAAMQVYAVVPLRFQYGQLDTFPGFSQTVFPLVSVALKY